MRILLVQPPIRDFYRTAFREYPLGLLYLASALESHGHHPAILDARRCKRPRAIPPPPELTDIADLFRAKGGPFPRYQHFGMGVESIGAAAAAARPDAICISALFTPYVGETIETARAVRDALPRCPIIVGGHHATADPASLEREGCIDLVIRGEGEEILPEILCHLPNARIAPSSGAPARIGDLDALPFPARHLINPDRYRFAKRRYTMLLTSRGCPHRCSFCSVHALSGHTHRVRSVEAVLEEIDECVRRHGIGAIDFQDDNLLFDADRIKGLFEACLVRTEGRGIAWMASNGVNAAHLDRELVRLMQRMGFAKLDLALGTGDVASRGNLLRPETTARYEEVLAWAEEAALPVTTYIILGIPFQTLSEMRTTVGYLTAKKTLIAPSIFYNVPGMPCFEEMRQYERSNIHAARRSSAFNCDGADFRREDIVRLFNEIRAYNTGHGAT